MSQFEILWALFLAVVFSLLSGLWLGVVVATIIIKVETNMRKRTKLKDCLRSCCTLKP
jgi:hypothetical protein